MSTSSATTVRRRTWSNFGDVRRMPSEYEIVTHGTNWTLRKGRVSALEVNPTSPANLWFLTFRDRSPLHVGDWNRFRDPDEVTYRRYVTMQDEQETIVANLLEEYANAGHDMTHSPAWRACLAKLFAPTRYSAHAMQMAYSYLAHMAPSSYISNCAAFAAADMLRRVSLIAYRSRTELAQYEVPEMGRDLRADLGSDHCQRKLWQHASHTSRNHSLAVQCLPPTAMHLYLLA